MLQKVPTLFTFRRCPYAIRARLALAAAEIVYESIEVDLKNKPEQLLLHSPKGTVPVLVLSDGSVLEQSLDIMYWALDQSSTHHALLEDDTFSALLNRLTQQNDNDFKRALDCYKYPNKYDVVQVSIASNNATDILKEWNQLLNNSNYFYRNKASIIDYALMPFVRQFAAVNQAYFEALAIPNIHQWLINLGQSTIFKKVMAKA